jgi:hypothetical protein
MGEVSFPEVEPLCDASSLHRSPRATTELIISRLLVLYVAETFTVP